jgi:4-deoxy-L-threo-5-hexosulose-uronate ketol-isomerase
MEIRHACSRKETAAMNTQELRANYLIETLFKENHVELVYSHFDRMVTGGVMPQDQVVNLPNTEGLKANYFLERRELGIMNLGGSGSVSVDGKTYPMNKLDCLYVGKGSQNVSFSSADALNPARFFLLSSPAHHTYPTVLMTQANATPAHLGAVETANQRTIYKYIHADGIKSCQLVMGLTVLKTGSVWNTMPPHLHDRRTEVYCYFDVPENQAVCHLMGESTETKHIWVQNHQSVISPPWSIHSGCGTSNYSFIWGMAGENQAFSDMDAVQILDLI